MPVLASTFCSLLVQSLLSLSSYANPTRSIWLVLVSYCTPNTCVLYDESTFLILIYSHTIATRFCAPTAGTRLYGADGGEGRVRAGEEPRRDGRPLPQGVRVWAAPLRLFGRYEDASRSDADPSVPFRSVPCTSLLLLLLSSSSSSCSSACPDCPCPHCIRNSWQECAPPSRLAEAFSWARVANVNLMSAECRSRCKSIMV